RAGRRGGRSGVDTARTDAPALRGLRAMYVDETGGTEPTVTSNEEMPVTVDGTEYATEMNIDLDHDGTPDAAVVNNADGSKSVYVDTDGDRVADEYAEVSA